MEWSGETCRRCFVSGGVCFSYDTEAKWMCYSNWSRYLRILSLLTLNFVQVLHGFLFFSDSFASFEAKDSIQFRTTL